MPKAKNREEFVQAWNEHMNQLYGLVNSLPLGDQALAYLDLDKKLRGFIEVAADATYGRKEEGAEADL